MLDTITALFAPMAYAQAGEVQGNFFQSGLGQMVPFVVMIILFYLLLIRPNRKRQREQENTLNSLKTGDVVLTSSGMIATIESVIDPRTFLINLGGIKVKIVKSGIAGKYSEETSLERK
ncbi:hypothetical protein RsTz2092_08780 [Deferribacterales bacterium RsTz2092]|nr:hypothetical protein AGMMS49941_06050 [Deferribacterales bacterium]